MEIDVTNLDRRRDGTSDDRVSEKPGWASVIVRCPNSGELSYEPIRENCEMYGMYAKTA